MVDFAKGVKVKVIKTQFGEIIKVGIKFDDFAANPITNSGYINFDIKRAKGTDKPYAVLNNYLPVKTDPVDDGAIPY